mmetsp:Transcript_40061/g.95694  ORF Transcript_40061/g.95694 Transcript_40061/m.95694 type:complete len:209 (-) Transcript_40061:219-845(-)
MPKPIRSWKNTLKRRWVKFAWSITGVTSRQIWPRARAGPQDAPSWYRTQGVGFARLWPSHMEKTNSATCQQVICQMKAEESKPGKISAAKGSSSWRPGGSMDGGGGGNPAGTAAAATPAKLLQGDSKAKGACNAAGTSTSAAASVHRFLESWHCFSSCSDSSGDACTCAVFFLVGRATAKVLTNLTRLSLTVVRIAGAQRPAKHRSEV